MKIDLNELETRLIASAFARQALIGERHNALQVELKEWTFALAEANEKHAQSVIMLLTIEINKRVNQLRSMQDRMAEVTWNEIALVLDMRSIPKPTENRKEVRFMAGSDNTSGFLEWSDAPVQAPEPLPEAESAGAPEASAPTARQGEPSHA